MTYTCTYHEELRAIVVTTEGTATLVDLQAMLRCVAELCNRHPSANILIDHRNLDVGLLSMDEIKSMSSLTIAAGDILQMRRCAHVARTELQFGLVRAWEIMIEIGGLTGFNAQVFRSRDAALAWLGASPWPEATPPR